MRDMQSRAAGTHRAFSHQVTTDAAPERIWDLWTTVSTWSAWDRGLKDAALEGAMEVGSVGRIIPKAGAPATFTVTSMDKGRAYAFTTDLPGARLVVRREIVAAAPTTFRHDVAFEGPLAWIWAALLGRGFRRDLLTTMDDLRDLAESQPPKPRASEEDNA